MQPYKLGKLPVKFKDGLLHLEKYVTPELVLPEPDATFEWPVVPAYQPFGNNQYGNCTCAAIGNIVTLDKALNGTTQNITQDEVLSLYSSVTGFDPSDPSTDNGAACTDILDYVVKNGFAGVKLLGYVAINPKNIHLIELALQLFGAAYAGVSMPATAQEQIGKIWTVVNNLQGDGTPDSWGGHCIPLVANNATDFTCVTWGAPQLLSKNFWWAYGTEVYAPIFDSFFSSGKAPNGFDVISLENDLKAFAA